MTEQSEQDQQNEQDPHGQQDPSKSVVVLFDKTVTSSDGQHYRFSGDNYGLVLIHRDNIEVYRASVSVAEVWDYERYSRDIAERTKNIADGYLAEDIPRLIERRRDVQKMLGYTQAEAREKAAEAAAIYKCNPTMLHETLAVAQFWATMAITAPKSRGYTAHLPSDAP